MPQIFVFLKLYKQAIVLLVLLSSTVISYADFSQCKDQLYAGNAPKIDNTALKRNLYPLCFNGFALAYSGVSRTPLWSAELLTPQRLKQA